MSSHDIQGRRLETPIMVRDATVCAAAYLVRADAARAVLAYSGLDVAEVLLGRAVCVLLFAQYRDGDLDAAHEFGVAFLVRPPQAGPPPGRGLLASLRDLFRWGWGLFVHWLPVDQSFTLAAGRTIWGFPKELADISLRLATPYRRCVLRTDGRLVVDLLIRPGLPLPVIRKGRGLAGLPAYTHLNGVTRRVPWTAWPRGVRWRPGGALVRLGNHPIAKELSELGLPKHAVLTATVHHLAMRIDAAELG